MKHGPALPVGNRAGRGLNPRPERSTPAKYLLKLSNARNAPPAKYPPTLPNSSPPPLPNPSHFPRLSNALAWVDHSGRGYNPRPAQSRNAPPLPNVCLQFQIRKARMLLVECRLGSTGRGVPVGNRAGRGLNPRPERSTPAKYSPTLPNSASSPLPNPSHFPRPSSALAWMDHSGRGFNPRPAQYNPRPAQTRPAQGHRLKNDNRHPPPLPQNLPRPL